MKPIRRFHNGSVTQGSRVQKMEVFDFPEIGTRHTIYRVPPHLDLEAAIKTVQGYKPGEYRFRYHVTDTLGRNQFQHTTHRSTEIIDPRDVAKTRQEILDKLYTPTPPERGTRRQQRNRQSSPLPFGADQLAAARAAAASQPTLAAQQQAYIDSLRRASRPDYGNGASYLEIEVIQRWPPKSSPTPGWLKAYG